MKNGECPRAAAPAMPAPEAVCRAVEELRAVCRDAWQEGLLPGCNGNASQRLEASGGGAGILCMTRTGAAKGRLGPGDICLLDAATGECLANGPASSEAAVHLALYATQPQCGAVLHTHPRRLLALSLVLRERGGDADLLDLPLFEADVWRARLAVAPALAPGTQELADAVAAAAGRLAPSAGNAAGGAVWMEGHGLCAFAPSLGQALTMSEELEHLAAIQLLTLGA